MKSKTRQHGFSTLAIHGGVEQGDVDSPVATPLVQSVNFVQEIGAAGTVRYPRHGNTPNAEIVQRRLAALDPDSPAEQRDLGMLYLRLDRPADAIAHLQSYLDACPPDPDAEDIHALLRAARRDAAMRN